MSTAYEQRAKTLANVSIGLGSIAFIGFAITAYSIARMLLARQRGDSLSCLHWQRVRLVSTSLSLSLLSIPILLPHLAHSSILFRTK